MAEEEKELTPKEDAEAFLSQCFLDNPKLQDYADFAVDDDGNISYEFKIDFTAYCVPFSEHFWANTHTGVAAMWINEFYAKFWLWAAKSCRGTNYKVVSENERYFVKYIDPEPQPNPEEGGND